MKQPDIIGKQAVLEDGTEHTILDIKPHTGGILEADSTVGQPMFKKGAFWKIKIKRKARAEWVGPVWFDAPAGDL